MEDCLPFVRVAGYLEAMQLNAPRVLEANLEQGFLVITDLGTQQYLDVLSSHPAEADTHYHNAIDTLLEMQERGDAYQSALPDYDAALLDFELGLFTDWLCDKHLGLAWSVDDAAQWDDVRTLLVHNALDQPQRFVHRDYHSRNLMVTPDSSPGILDFQDALEGPLTYDIVSLLRDCYIAWPAERVDAWLERFYAGLDDDTRQAVAPATFRRHFDLMGAQRHLKAAGIFARLNIRDGKDRYLADIPRTLGYVSDVAARYADLGFLGELIDGRVLPALEASA